MQPSAIARPPDGYSEQAPHRLALEAGPGEDATFTFTGTRKPPAEPDLAKAGAHAAPDTP